MTQPFRILKCTGNVPECPMKLPARRYLNSETNEVEIFEIFNGWMDGWKLSRLQKLRLQYKRVFYKNLARLGGQLLDAARQ